MSVMISERRTVRAETPRKYGSEKKRVKCSRVSAAPGSWNRLRTSISPIGRKNATARRMTPGAASAKSSPRFACISARDHLLPAIDPRGAVGVDRHGIEAQQTGDRLIAVHHFLGERVVE